MDLKIKQLANIKCRLIFKKENHESGNPHFKRVTR